MAKRSHPTKSPRSHRAPVTQDSVHQQPQSGGPSSEVDEVSEEPLVPPTEAYKHLLGLLSSDLETELPRTAPNQLAKKVKARKATLEASDPAAGDLLATGSAQNPRDGEAQAAKRGSATEASEEAELPQKRLKKGDEDPAMLAEPSATMLSHVDRQITEAEMQALAKPKFSEVGDGPFREAWPEGSWLISGKPLPQVLPLLSEYGFKQRQVGLWREAHSSLPEGSDFQTRRQQAFFNAVRSYKDVFLSNHQYSRSVKGHDELEDAALLHCIDHVVASSQRIKKHKEVLKANPDADVARDQGFTRPKVLILLPMRNAALKIATRLLELARKETRSDSVQGKARFLEDFGADEEDELKGKAGKQEAERKLKAPAEHTALFSGNLDDHFRFGIKLTKGAIKLFADFYQSDILIASPIGLVTKQPEGEADSANNLDFLSSVEIVLVPRCDVLLMQNWSHVSAVFEALNKLPEETHGADIMRVYDWCLAGNARYYRQNILLSSFASPEMNALFSRQCLSHAGKVKLRCKYQGVLGKVDGQLRQMFERFWAQSPSDEAEMRFDRFKERIWPRIRDSGSGGQFIFVPSYFDYLRLRAFLVAEQIEFEGLDEYSSGSEVARSRSRFTAGKTRLAVYTERSHFYHRRRTKGIKDLFFYQLPEHAHFYTELVGMAASVEGSQAGHVTITALFSNLDLMRLERVVGSTRAQTMLKSSTGTFLFC